MGLKFAPLLLCVMVAAICYVRAQDGDNDQPDREERKQEKQEVHPQEEDEPETPPMEAGKNTKLLQAAKEVVDTKRARDAKDSRIKSRPVKVPGAGKKCDFAFTDVLVDNRVQVLGKGEKTCRGYIRVDVCAGRTGGRQQWVTDRYPFICDDLSRVNVTFHTLKETECFCDC